MPFPQVSPIETAIDPAVRPSERRVGHFCPEQHEALRSDVSSITRTLKLFSLEQIHKSASLLLLLLFLLVLLPLVDCCHCHHCCRRCWSKMCLVDGILFAFVLVLLIHLVIGLILARCNTGHESTPCQSRSHSLILAVVFWDFL